VKRPRLDDNHIPVDAERLMNMGSVDEWLSSYQSVKHFANAAHTTITAQHYKIQELKAEVFALREELSSWRSQHGCGCGHPSCKRCVDDRCVDALLGENDDERMD